MAGHVADAVAAGFAQDPAAHEEVGEIGEAGEFEIIGAWSAEASAEDAGELDERGVEHGLGEFMQPQAAWMCGRVGVARWRDSVRCGRGFGALFIQKGADVLAAAGVALGDAAGWNSIVHSVFGFW